MTARARRRRAGLLLALALACGGLAASEVGRRVGEVERRVGAPVPVAVAARNIAPGDELARRDVEVREIPERYAPPDALAAAEQAAGQRTTVPVAAGSPLTAGLLGAGGGGRPGALRRGERALEVPVAGLDDQVVPGARVDVVVSTEPRDGPGRTFLALEDVELLAARPAAGAGGGSPAGRGEGAGAAASAIATLRVTLRQAVYLTAAQNYAREVRLLPRPPGDRRRAGRAAVAAGAL